MSLPIAASIFAVIGADRSSEKSRLAHALGHGDTILSAAMGADTDEKYDRDLGVIEAITYVTRSCPNGAVVSAAERALEAIKESGSEVLRQQAYFVLTSIKGWRGDRARQVHRSLTRYLEQSTPSAPDPSTPSTPAPTKSRTPQSPARS